jgi:hypothetical protein
MTTAGPSSYRFEPFQLDTLDRELRAGLLPS